MRTILFVAPLFEDDTSAGIAERAFVESVAKEGNVVTVICIEGKNVVAIPGIDVVRIQESKFVYNLFRVLRKIHFTDLMQSPDHFRYSWNRTAFKMVKHICKKKNFDIVHSFCFPCSSHLLAYKIHSYYGFPWIAHFMDPWVGNPIRKFKSDCGKQYDAKQEEVIVRNAQFILHTNDKIIQDWITRYGDAVRYKIGKLPLVNTWSPDIQYSKEEKDKFTITHIGTFHAGRNAMPFLLALKEVNEKRPEMIRKIRAVFVGGYVNGDIKRTEEYGLTNCVEWKGRISEKECEQYYKAADMFLAIDCSFEYDYFYPSKILKYFSSRHPILGLVSGDNTILAEEMRNSGNVPINMEDTQSIANYLMGVIGGTIDTSGFDKDYWRHYSPEGVMKVYNGFLSNVQNKLANF